MKKIYFLLIGFCFLGNVHAQIVNIPDAKFKAKLLEASSSNQIAKDLSGKFFKIDANNDGEIQESEALQLSYLGVSGNIFSSLLGIEKFTNLQILYCNENGLSTSLNLSGLTKLQELDCSSNPLTSLNVSGLTNLQNLNCYSVPLTSLNLSGLTKLQYLNCRSNRLTSLDLSGLINIQRLDCPSNRLTSLDVSGLINLQWLDCNYNQLTTLDISALHKLESLFCYKNSLKLLNLNSLSNLKLLNCAYNQLTSIDLSSQINLEKLYCDENNLTSLLIKNTKIAPYNSGILNLGFSNNNIKYICADEKQLVDVQSLINQNGYTNCHVNTYCSFVPGGKFYTIQGNPKVDSNTNGCDVLDASYPNLKLSITDGTNIGNFISNARGSYSIPVSAGTHTITPVLENPNYYTVSPASINITFPTQTSPFTQNYCITPNGVHPDLEVSFLPINRARPGFDASYKIIYKNKGTTTQSGSVKLTFDDAVLDLVSTNPVATSQSSDNLSWEYLDLKPFETRAIEVTLNVNSPMETPAVNINDRLSFTALINPVTGDELPVDNSFALRQLVVGSYDPNDKTCLEGSTIPPSAVGKYVHYMIRFENKGTAEAENVVIKDLIDTTKFDISSLVVTEGSHPFVTKISDTNKVEFIFEKINLPFDDATNDGYVAFKIKTKPSLVLGDSFSNTASIYFDYNFPIITNTATTSVLQSLGTQDFEFSSYFNVYPNPAKEVLNIYVKKQIELSSISIFNTLGQQILVIPNAQQTKQVDVSSLKTGNYFIKVSSNKGSASGKFVKN